MKKSRKLTSVFLSLCTVISCMAGLSFTAGAENDPRLIVAIGDSYSSGESIEPYFGQDNDLEIKVTDPDWLVHRSTLAWSGQLTLDGVPMKHNENWYFAAASGARTRDLAGNQTVNYSKGSLKGTVEIAPQLDIFNDLSLTANDYVTITIGGNDIGFVDIMTCAVLEALQTSQPAMAQIIIDNMPENYRELAKKTASEIVEDTKAHFNDDGGIRSNIKAAYRSIAQKAGDAAIIVAGYPKLFNEDGFTMSMVLIDVTFTKELCDTVNNGVSWFNNEAAAIVRECAAEGMNIHFVDVQEAFRERGAYTEDPYINGFVLGAKEQDINDTEIVSSSSMHPNQSGAALYAAAVQAEIDRCEFDAYRQAQKNAADELAGADDIDLVTNAKAAIDALIYDAGMSLAANKAAVDAVLIELREQIKNRHQDDYVPSYIPAYIPVPAATTVTSSDTATMVFTGEETISHTIYLEWSGMSGAAGYLVSVEADGGYVPLVTTTKTNIDVIHAANGRYYVTEGGDYTEYVYKNGSFVKSGTVTAAKADTLVRANNVTDKFALQYKKNGQLSSAKTALTTSVRIYYKPALTLTTGTDNKTGKSYIRLKWAKVEGATAYKVCRYVNGKLRTVAELDADKLSARITGTKSGRTYTYAVKALVDGKWTGVYNYDLATIVPE